MHPLWDRLNTSWNAFSELAGDFLSTFFKDFILVTLAEHYWIVPMQARDSLTRLVDSTMHAEFASPHLL